MAPRHFNYRRKRSNGTAYLVKLTIGITLLMLVNGYVVGLVVQGNLKYIPAWLHDVRLYQFCQILFSFLLVVGQLWLYDRVRDAMPARQG